MMIGTDDDLAHRAGHVEPVDAGQSEVEHDQVRDDRADQSQRVLARPCRRHPEPGVDQVVAHDVDDRRLVVDDEHVLHDSIMARRRRAASDATRAIRRRGHTTDDAP